MLRGNTRRQRLRVPMDDNDCGNGSRPFTMRSMLMDFHLHRFRKEVAVVMNRFELAVFGRESERDHKQRQRKHPKEPGNFFQLPQSKKSITFPTMLRRTAISLLVLGSSLSAQENSKPENALQALSGATEALSKNVSRSVVQIFSTGYSFNTDDSQSTNTSLVTRQRSTGSGVVLSPEGYIVTNAHVVQSARRVQVRLSYATPAKDKEKNAPPHRDLMDAKIIGIDREADLAVIKIDMTGLSAVQLGNSDALRQGQIVIAVGNPLGLENSVSLGVISSAGRQVKTDDPMSYIQTDASINPGNSGGPLIDTNGRVVGINTFIYTQSGGSEGIGFAIPSNLVRTVYTQLRKNGHVHRGQIGVSVESVTPALAAGLRLPQDYGVLVEDVSPDGPASEAGLKPMDIVAAINGKVLDNASELQRDLYRRELGEKISLDILRGEDKLSIGVTVAEREDDPQRFADMVTPEANTVSKLGILGIAIDQKTSPMLPDLRKSYGVIVAARAANPPYSGNDTLQQGDVIYSVNREPIASIEALRSTLDALAPGDPLIIQIERNGKLAFLSLELE
jgi:serine protease Do